MRDSSESPRRQVDNAFVQAIVYPSSPQLPGTCLSSSIIAYLDYLNNAVCLCLITYRSQELSSMRLTWRPLRLGRVVYALCVVVGVGFLFYTFAAFRDLSPSTSDSGGVNPRILFPSAPIRGNNGSGPNRPKSPAGESPEQQGRMQWVQLPDGNPIAHPVAGAPAVVPEVGIPVPPKLPEFPVPDSDSDKDRPPGVVEPPRLPVEGRGTPLSVDEVRGGEPSDDLNKERRNKVKDTARDRSRNDDSFRQFRKMTEKLARDDRKPYCTEIETSMEQASNTGDIRGIYQLIHEVSGKPHALEDSVWGVNGGFIADNLAKV
ncbi:hypothetical protein SprV_0501779800 [Sparganum proliferum]